MCLGTVNKYLVIKICVLFEIENMNTKIKITNSFFLLAL